LFDFSTECLKIDLADLKANMKVPINIMTIDHMFDEGLSFICSEATDTKNKESVLNNMKQKQ
jgi:hypothetical protein